MPALNVRATKGCLHHARVGRLPWPQHEFLVDGQIVEIPFPVIVDPRTHEVRQVPAVVPWNLPKIDTITPPRWQPPDIMTFEMAPPPEMEPEIGAVTGLAWTATGGDLMTIEALRMPGTGKLTVTGQLGDVMRESVDEAYSFVRSRAVCPRASVWPPRSSRW